MYPEFVEPPRYGLDKPGWCVFDGQGNFLEGPFEDRETAEEWIEQNPTTPKP